MNGLPPSRAELAALAWSEHNQRWLAARHAAWTAALAEDLDASALAEPPDPADQPPGFEPAAARLAALFGLSPFETELLVLAAGVELDRGLRAALARVQGNDAPLRLHWPTALALLADAHWDALAPQAPLRRWQLIEVDLGPGVAEARLRISERLLHALSGVDAIDESLLPFLRVETTRDDAPMLPLADRLGAAITGSLQPLVLLSLPGNAAASLGQARTLATAGYASAGLDTVLWVDVAAVASSHGDRRDLAAFARRLDREAALREAGIALATHADTAVATHLIAALQAPVIAIGSLSALELAELPDRRLFRHALPDAPRLDLDALPVPVGDALRAAREQFRVDDALLGQALEACDGGLGPAALADQLWDQLRVAARGGLDSLASRIDSRASFDDLVLPPGVLAQLEQIASHLAHRHIVHQRWGFAGRSSRGLGIAALFTGDSGTGKTLAAEAIANRVRLDLYRIDLSSLVSKYIGETEKNLARLFDAAEASGAVLLFDEADALFGKRGEVKDSHDRYANIEVSYLLQRIEAYRGLAILTTNLKSALDRAFLRRLRHVVSFPYPDAAARAAIWQRQFPPQAPLACIDWPSLARLQLSGGEIRSVALNAAFDAAASGSPITQQHLLAAARAEYAKQERSFATSAGAGR
jgi:hypothetical protein